MVLKQEAELSGVSHYRLESNPSYHSPSQTAVTVTFLLPSKLLTKSSGGSLKKRRVIQNHFEIILPLRKIAMATFEQNNELSQCKIGLCVNTYTHWQDETD